MYEDIGDLDKAFDHLSKGKLYEKVNYSIKKDEILFNSLKKYSPIY